MKAPTVSDVSKYILLSALSSYGIVLLCFIMEMLSGLAFRSQNRFLDYAFWGPTFAVPVSVALALGYLAGPKLPRLGTMLVFVVPLAIALYDVATWIRYSYSGEPMMATIMNNFLTSNCGSSECLEEVVTTAPLLSSLAFAVGAGFRSLLFNKSGKVQSSQH